MSAVSVINQLCTYFGGPYDQATHTYHTPQLSVPGLTMGAVRRAKPKRLDTADYFLGAAGTGLGCQIMFGLTPGEETREGFGGATAGLKKVRHSVDMWCLIRSVAQYAEDVQDVLYALQDAVREHIHADRTCGSGGIEVGGFMVGEGGAPGIRWHDSEVESTAERTEALLTATFAADEYIIA